MRSSLASLMLARKRSRELQKQKKSLQPEVDPKQAAKWRRAAVAIGLVAAILMIAPLVAQFALSRETEPPKVEDAEKKEQADEVKAEGEEEEGEAKAEGEGEEKEEKKPARSGLSSWMPFHGGGGGGGGASSSDKKSCSQVASGARRRAAAPKHPGLGKALDAAGGSVLGAAVQSLRGVEMATDDDARAAEAYSECISGR